MRGLLILLTTLFTLTRVVAQQEMSFSLEECIEYALNNNEQIEVARLDQEIADAEVRKTLAQGLPQANVNTGLNYNFEPAKSLIDISTFDPTVPTGTEQEVSFAQNYDGQFGLTIDQLIFNGSYFVGLQASRTYRELSQKDHIKSQIDIVEAVSKAFYNSLIAREQLALINKNVGRLDTLLFETEQMKEAGFAEKVDVDRIRVNYNNLLVEQSKLNQLNELSEKLLKFQMGMDLNQPLILNGSLEDVDVQVPVLPSTNFDYSKRIEFSQLLTNESLVFLDMKNNRVQYLPKLDASLSYGWNTATAESSKLFRGRRWLNYGTIGISANIPIFDGFLKSNRIQQNKIQALQIESQKRYLKKSIDLEIEESRINLTSQLETLDVQKQNVDLAQDVYDITKVKYQEGVGSNLEVIDADASLKEAQTNYLNALFEAINSEIELKKALGILYNN